MTVSPATQGERIVLVFENIEVGAFEPIHLVTLACLIEFLDRQGYVVSLQNTESPVHKFLFETLQFPRYWKEGQNYVPANSDSIFNLWRLVEAEIEGHSQRIHDYLQKRLFKNKDLSAVKNSLVEAYYNIFDHAEAGGNAFSLIKYDGLTEKLHVAICDFGRGIADTVKEKVPDITEDYEALGKAMEDLFTINSKTHNMGLGLGNIRRTCTESDKLRILSNQGFLYANSDFIQIQPNNFYFCGTLIYYELSLSHFDELEIIANFEL